MTQEEYLNQIEHQLRQLLEEVRQDFATLPVETLTMRLPIPKKWNVLECFEHLNRVYATEIPKLEYAIHKAKARKSTMRPTEHQETSWYAQKMRKRYSADNPRRTKTSKKWIPFGADLTVAVVKSLIIQMEKMLRVIQQAKEVDLNKTKLKRTKWSLFSINLGNFLELVTLHTERHLYQAKQIIREIK